MKQLAILCTLLFSKILLAQNTGIGTTTPQATLDVKGNQRIGGTTKFTSFDSLSGKISWVGANLFVPAPQYLMQHSASAEGLYYANSKLMYLGISDTAFYTDWSNGDGFFRGNVGIGLTTPRSKLHVFTGYSGNPFPYAPMVVEGDNNTYIDILTPDASESGVLFGNATDAASGGIVYNNTDPFPGNANGFQFRTNGNITRMVLTSNGNLGIATGNPTEKLEVNGNIKATAFKYPAPKTFYCTIPGLNFRSENSADTVRVNLGYGSTTIFSFGYGRRLIAAVQLPQNAVMQHMTAYLADNSGTYDMTVTLYRKTMTSTFFPSNLGNITSSGTSIGATLYTTTIASTFNSNEVDNSLYTYYISVASTGTWTSNMDTIAIVIDYTMDGTGN
jgi:hypothetical protein